jgi:hypothetical protein
LKRTTRGDIIYKNSVNIRAKNKLIDEGDAKYDEEINWDHVDGHYVCVIVRVQFKGYKRPSGKYCSGRG